MDRLEKGIHYKSNKGSVKESLNKCINFYLLKSFRLTFIRVVYKSRQPAKFAGYSATFRRLLSTVDQLLNI